MKKLDWLVVKSFTGPFILTFFIAQFVLVMQFLWKYVDDLVGKGLEIWILSKLILYASASLVTLALPLAVLLSSIMTYGSFGEHYELTAVKSSGISLMRFMLPLMITVMGISLFALYFSNNILPEANLKFKSLLYDITHQKPTVAIKPGIFYSGIDGYFIRVKSKDDKTNTLYDITVYDHTSGHGNDHVITASQGSMTQDEEQMSLQLHLQNGRQYREIDPKDPQQKENNHEMMNTSFSSWEKRFDLSQFKLARTDESYFKGLKQMLNLRQLTGLIDTMRLEQQKTTKGMVEYNRPYFYFDRYRLDSSKTENISPIAFKQATDLLNEYNKDKKIQVMELAMTKARNIKNYAEVTSKQVDFKDHDIILHLIEVYRKFTLSIACLVLFFIGAPLGSIIRKGGLGWPLFYCVLLFIVYHVTSMIGEKLAENNVLTAFGGMWLSTVVLLPVGIFLTFKATMDSRLFNFDYYRALLGSRKFATKTQV